MKKIGKLFAELTVIRYWWIMLCNDGELTPRQWETFNSAKEAIKTASEVK